MKKTKLPVSATPKKTDGLTAPQGRGIEPVEPVKPVKKSAPAVKPAAPAPQLASPAQPKAKAGAKTMPKTPGRSAHDDTPPSAELTDKASERTPEAAKKAAKKATTKPLVKVVPKTAANWAANLAANMATEVATIPAKKAKVSPKLRSAPVLRKEAQPLNDPLTDPLTEPLTQPLTQPIAKTLTEVESAPLVQAVAEPARIPTDTRDGADAASLPATEAPPTQAPPVLTDAMLPATPLPLAPDAPITEPTSPALPMAATPPAPAPAIASAGAESPTGNLSHDDALPKTPATGHKPRRPAKAKKRKPSGKTSAQAPIARAKTPTRAKPRTAPAIDPALVMAQMLEEARAALVLDEAKLWEKDNPVKTRLAQLKSRHALLQEQLQRIKPPVYARGKKP